MEWKKKKMEEREANLAKQRADRAKNDRMRYHSLHSFFLLTNNMCSSFGKSSFGGRIYLLGEILCSLSCSGRELFMSDASWFVDDVGAYDKYDREEESAELPKVNLL